jgi:uncharacterized protein
MRDKVTSAASLGDVPDRALLPFVLVTFGLAWGLLGLFLFFQPWVEAVFGTLSGRHPLFVLAVYAPAIAAVIVVVHHAGFDGLLRFLSRTLLWRAAAPWWAFLLVGIPVLFVIGAWLKGGLPGATFAFPPLPALLLAMAATMAIGPVEEFGWRGIGLPLLQRRFAPFWAGLILGVIWGAWHLPAFFLSGTPQSGWSFAPFFFASVAASVIVTALFNDARGSILLAALFHFQLNNPLWPDAQPYDTLAFVAAAAVIVWFRREAMFRKDAGSTTVIPEALSRRPAPGQRPTFSSLR